MLTFVLSVIGAVLGAASLVLHAVGAKYPTAEKYAEDVDAVDAVAKPMLPAPAPVAKP